MPGAPKLFRNSSPNPVYVRVFEDGVQVTQESVEGNGCFTHIPAHEHSVVEFRTPEAVEVLDPRKPIPPAPAPAPVQEHSSMHDKSPGSDIPLG